MSRTDEMIRYLEEHRAAIDGWPRGSLYIDWGGDDGFSVKLVKSERVGAKRAVDRLRATA